MQNPSIFSGGLNGNMVGSTGFLLHKKHVKSVWSTAEWFLMNLIASTSVDLFSIEHGSGHCAAMMVMLHSF